MKRKQIIILGPYPPPIGGVAVHVSRLVNRIKENYHVKIINTSKNWFLQGLKLIRLIISSSKNKTVIHNHIFKIKFNSLIVFISRLFKIRYVQTFHSFRINIDKLSKLDIRLIKYIIKNSYTIVVVNDVIKEMITKIDYTALKKIYVIPAFIPYNKRFSKVEKDNYLNSLKINNFINSHEVILCANAFKITFYNMEDLYGIDLCIELEREIKNASSRKVGFIFMLPQIGDVEYFNFLKKQIKDYGIEEDFIFINKELDLVPLFEYIDIFLRPTNTDGDALSIREALYEGVPTIASDIVERPLGTITFKNRDLKDLTQKTLDTIDNIDFEKEEVENTRKMQNEYIEKYRLIYEDFKQ